MAAKLTVFPSHYITQITTAIAAKCGEALNKNPLFLTKDEFIEAFIRPEHVGKLREVYELLAESRMEAIRTTINCNPNDAAEVLPAHVAFHADVGLFVPKYAATTLNFGTPVATKIVEWAAERRRLGVILGDAIDAVVALNELCGNALAMSIAFPALGSIMTRSCTSNEAAIIDKDPVVKRGRTIGLGKSIGKLPGLPREVVDRLRTASAMVQALLLAEDATVSVPPGTAVSLKGVRWADGNAPREIAQRPTLIQHIKSTTTTYV